MSLSLFLKRTTVALTALICTSVNAEPWVDTSNVFLRESIEHLADLNIITTPTTTFPLMWHDIDRDISNVSTHLLSEDALNSYLYIKHQLKLAKRNQKRVALNSANENARFTSFGDSYRDNNNVQIHTSFLNDYVAVKLSPRINTSPSDGDKVSYDESYLATYLGNWIFSIGMQDRWWGPGWDTSLSMSNNARPIPALALSRKSAIPVTIPFTEYEIPWTVTSYMGVMDDERIIKDTLLWGFRLNFRPAQNWEIGLTRLAQWAGENRPKGFSTFLDVLAGLDNCGGVGPSIEKCAAGEEPGNQLAGYDIRYSTQIFNHPIAFNFSSFAEDGDSKGGLSILGEERYQFGIDTRVNAFNRNWRIFAEWTDTYATCLDGNNGDGTSKIGNCYYEHHLYKTGMRYKGRVVGNIYENDATSVVLGAISQVKNDLSFQTKLRWLQLNKDNSDKAPNDPQIGNTLTPIAEDMLMLSGKIQYSYKNWRYTLGTSYSKSTFDNDTKDNSDVNLYLNIELNLK